MEPLPLIAVALAGLVGAGMAGVAGWGGWILPGALAWLLLDPYVALVMSCLFALGVDFTLLIRERQHLQLGAARGLLLPILLGLVAGTLLLGVLEQRWLQLAAGVLLVAGALPSWWGRLAGRPAVGGAAAGLFTMIGGFNGPPLALALDGLPLRARRGTLGLLFCGLAVAGLAGMLAAGIPTADWRQGVLGGLLLAPLASLGTLLGMRLADRHLSLRALVWLTRALCLAAGVSLLVRAVLN